MGTRLRLLSAVIVALAAAVPARAVPLQPGAQVGPGCTLNFVYDGQGSLAGRVYIGTAAHCVDGVGHRMKDADGVIFGRVVLMGTTELDFDRPRDYALIEVEPAHHGRVDPAMAGHPELPSGVAALADVAVGDMLQMSGYGLGYGATQETRERRQAVLTEYEREMYNSLAPVAGGDSGGPIAHVESGRALGLVSGWDFLTPGNLNGPMIAFVLEDAARRGFPVRMRAAGEPPPPPPPTPPPAPPAGQPGPGAAPAGEPEPRKANRRKACAKGKKAKRKKRGKRRPRRCGRRG